MPMLSGKSLVLTPPLPGTQDKKGAGDAQRGIRAENRYGVRHSGLIASPGPDRALHREKAYV
jgi:hypothetical protein